MRHYAALIGFGCFLLLGWNGVLIPALILSVEEAFQQSDAALGGFFFVTALCYAAGAFLGGLLNQRSGPRLVLPAAAALVGLGLGGQALAPGWVAFVLAALAVGWGSGAIEAGVNALFLALYAGASGRALNLLNLFYSLGALLGPLAVGQLVSSGVPFRAIIGGTAAGWLVLATLLATQPRAARAAHPGPASDPGRSLAGRAALPLALLAAAMFCYVAAELGVSTWLVRFLGPVAPLTTATATLSVFWGGLAVGRAVGSVIADRIGPVVFATGCIALGSVALIGAAATPGLPLTIALFALAGLCFGPVYPMIMVLGARAYPDRLSAVSGTIAAAGILGAVVYPPLIGVIAAQAGIALGIVGAGLLGVPTVVAVIAGSAASRRDAAARA